MRRKLVKQGRNALTVTLPAKWTQKYGLNAGDEVEIGDVEKGLFITTEKDKSLNMYEFDTRDLKEFRNYYLSYFYHKGYDELKIYYTDQRVMEITRKKLNELMGYEIVETGKGYFIIKSVSKADENEFDVLLRRTFILVKSMAEECFDAIKTKDYGKLVEIRNLEKTNNKFTDFCIRILNKGGYKNSKKTTSLYLILRDIERLCDSYKHICDIMKTSKKTFAIDKGILSFFGKVNDYFAEFYGIFYKFDEKRVHDFMNGRKTLLEEGHSLVENKKHKEVLLLYHLMNILNQTFELKGPLFEMNLD